MTCQNELVPSTFLQQVFNHTDDGLRGTVQGILGLHKVAHAMSIGVDCVDLPLSCEVPSLCCGESGQPEGRRRAEAVDEEDWGGGLGGGRVTGDEVDAGCR